MPTAFSHAIVFSGLLQAPAVTLLRNQLAFLNQPSQSQIGMTHLPATDLLIVFSSLGGQTHEMRSLYDLLRSLPYSIEIHVAGGTKSSAVPLILAADRRTAAPNTSFVFHPWACGVDANPGHIMEVLRQLPMQLEDDIAWGKKVLEERTNLTADKIEELKLFDSAVIWDADTALEHGLIHEIVETKIPPGIMTWNVA